MNIIIESSRDDSSDTSSSNSLQSESKGAFATCAKGAKVSSSSDEEKLLSSNWLSWGIGIEIIVFLSKKFFVLIFLGNSKRKGHTHLKKLIQ